jgi:hypothetical protein
MDEPACFSRVQLIPGAEILATAGGAPLLYRHSLGRGTVYGYAWNLDVFIYQGSTLDHYSDAWDGLWRGLAKELSLWQQMDSPTQWEIREMTGQNSIG